MEEFFKDDGIDYAELFRTKSNSQIRKIIPVKGLGEIPPQVDCEGYHTSRKIYPRCKMNCVNCPYQEYRK